MSEGAQGPNFATLESIRKASHANITAGSGASGGADTIGIGGEMMPSFVSGSLDMGFGGDIGAGIKRFAGALEKNPTDLGNMDPIGLQGVGVTNKDLQSLGQTGFENVAPGKQFNANAPTGALGLGGQGGGHEM